MTGYAERIEKPSGLVETKPEGEWKKTINARTRLRNGGGRNPLQSGCLYPSEPEKRAQERGRW
jgi:hypothetical protein